MISQHDEATVGPLSVQQASTRDAAPGFESVVNEIPDKLAGLNNIACLQEAVTNKNTGA